jgi:FdhD protein
MPDTRPSAELKQIQDPLGLFRLGYAGTLLEKEAIRWGREGPRAGMESIAEETPVAIAYNGQAHVVMMATPQDLEEFALGFSLTEELIRAPRDFLGVEVVRYGQGVELQVSVAAECQAVIAARSRRLSGRTGCGICGAESFAAVMKQVHTVAAGPAISAAAIHRAVAMLPARQTLNAAAGAVHAAAWATLDGEVTLVREDVGRHNALDKLIGALTRAETEPRSGFVVVTSRASFEMVQKTTVLGAPLMAAISGPTGLAVRLAQQSGLTLVGFCRPERFTVYTHAERLAE